jgi:rod shape determining protein RodA
VGYVALYSAGGGNPDLYATKHALRFGFCLVLMLCIGLVDIRLIAKLAPLAYLAGIGLLVMVALHGEVGRARSAGSTSGQLQLQPSEAMKVILVLTLAWYFHRASWERMGNPLFLIPPAVLVLIPVGLIFKQPNLGTALITAMIGGAMFWAAGMRWWKFAIALGGAAAAAPFAYGQLKDYQRARSRPFLDPRATRSGPATTSSSPRSRSAPAGSGERVPQGTQGHLNFLPEKQTDFIFTMIARSSGSPARWRRSRCCCWWWPSAYWWRCAAGTSSAACWRSGWGPTSSSTSSSTWPWSPAASRWAACRCR